jgi:hypothetical protein
MIESEYEYRLKAGRVETRGLLYGAGALFMAYMGLTNDRGLVLFVIPLSQQAATVFYWVFAGLGALFCGVDLMNAERRKSLRQRIALTKDAVLVPRSPWTQEEQRIPYETIVEMRPFDAPDHIVVIRHQAGDFTLRLAMLSDERAYAKIVQSLTEAVALARAKARTGTLDVKPSPAAGPPG